MISMPVSERLLIHLYSNIPELSLYLQLNFKAHLVITEQKNGSMFRGNLILFKEPAYHSLFLLKFHEHLHD